MTKKKAPAEQPHISQCEIVGGFLMALGKLGAKFMNQRQVNAVIEAANVVHEQINRPTVIVGPNAGTQAWLASDRTGLSSRYMAYVLVPVSVEYAKVPHPGNMFGETPYPHDADDFGRCINLLDAEPKLRPHLSALDDPEKHGPEWSAIIRNWTELETLHREKKFKTLNERMGELLDGCRNPTREEE